MHNLEAKWHKRRHFRVIICLVSWPAPW